MKISKSQLKQIIKEEIEDTFIQKSPERADDQQSYEMAMDASRQSVMDIFGEDVGSMAWELITTALHAEPGSFEGVMNLHQEIADLKEL
tara:strand:+ start:357 stop:623 length:267 start_codon:yes stop_codon:yes gene_type:complete